MKKLTIVAAIVAFASVANAQIAVVDTQYVFENANITKQVNEEILEVTKTAKDKIKAEERKLASEKDALLAQKSVLSKDVYAQREEELKKKVFEFRRNLKETQKELNITNKQKKQEIAEKISQAVDKIAKENNYDAVISKTFLMYNKESIEITEKVLTEVNAK